MIYVRFILGCFVAVVVLFGCGKDGSESSVVVGAQPGSDDVGAAVQPDATSESLPTRVPLEGFAVSETTFGGEVLPCIDWGGGDFDSPPPDLGQVEVARRLGERIRVWVVARPEIRRSTADEYASTLLEFVLRSDAVEEVVWPRDWNQPAPDVWGTSTFAGGGAVAEAAGGMLLLGLVEPDSPLLQFFGAPGRWRPVLECGNPWYEAFATEVAHALGDGEDVSANRLTEILLAAHGLPTEGVDPAALRAITEQLPPPPTVPTWQDLDPMDRFVEDAPIDVLRRLRNVTVEVRVPEQWRADTTGTLLCTRYSMGWGSCSELSLDPIRLDVYLDDDPSVTVMLMGPISDISESQGPVVVGPTMDIGVVDTRGAGNFVDVVIESNGTADAVLDAEATAEITVVRAAQ